MAKIQAKHNVDKNVARFGVADSQELCELVAQSIPADVLKNAKRILDVGIGCGGIARAVVKRLVNELYVDHFDAMFRVYGVDNNLALVKKAERNGIRTAYADFLEWDPEMQFDVIVGNPPYQNPDKVKKAANGRSANGTPLWVKFIEKSASLLEPSGYLSLVVPAAVATPGSRGMRKAADLSLVSMEFGLESHFNVKTNIALVTWTKGLISGSLKVNGLNYPQTLPIANVQNQSELNRLQKIWSGRSEWKYMDNRSHGKRANRDGILVVRRMYSGSSFAWNYGLDMDRFDRESVIGLEGVSEVDAQKWGAFFDSDDGIFLRRVTNYAGNISAEFLKPVAV